MCFFELQSKIKNPHSVSKGYDIYHHLLWMCPQASCRPSSCSSGAAVQQQCSSSAAAALLGLSHLAESAESCCEPLRPWREFLCDFWLSCFLPKGLSLSSNCFENQWNEKAAHHWNKYIWTNYNLMILVFQSKQRIPFKGAVLPEDRSTEALWWVFYSGCIRLFLSLEHLEFICRIDCSPLNILPVKIITFIMQMTPSFFIQSSSKTPGVLEYFSSTFC